jgi:hypothetical protein
MTQRGAREEALRLAPSDHAELVRALVESAPDLDDLGDSVALSVDKRCIGGREDEISGRFSPRCDRAAQARAR